MRQDAIYKILVAAVHYPVASGRYITRALRRLGHDVRTIGPCTGNEIWGMKVDERHVWIPDISDTLAQQGAGLAYYITDEWHPVGQDGWLPDLVLTADSAYTLAPVGKSEPYILYGVDNHVRDYRASGIKAWDHLFLAHHDGPALPVNGSRPNMHWLPCGYDPNYFTPSPIPWEDRDYDVCMIGVAYPRRVEIVSAMMEAGLKVFAATGLLYEEYARAYHNARISLCVSAAGDVAQRIFETAAMGCLILTDPLSDMGRLGALDGQQYVQYEHARNGVDAVWHAQRLMADSERARMIAHKGQGWARPQTWDARCQVILDTIWGGK